MRHLLRIFAAVAALLAVPLWPALANIQKIRHVVVVVQENRTPDNIFHGLRAVLPSADIADRGADSRGRTITLTPIALADTYDLDHSHAAYVSMYDGGKMDGADLIICEPGRTMTCPALPQFSYVQPADVAPYRAMAVNYGFANRMFQTNQGPSFPAHQYILAGTSAPDSVSPDFAAENPEFSTSGAGFGCTAAPAQLVQLIEPTGKEDAVAYPCFEHATLTDLLDAARPPLSWRYYTPVPPSSVAYLWDAPIAIAHMCQPKGQPLSCAGPDFSHEKVFPTPAQILADIQSNRLRAVSWVIPTGLESDHAGYNDGSGPSWVASVVNAIGGSHYWQDTVVLITWDDWGGWYDHVPPPIDPTYGYYEYGFRVPLLVVSAYTPRGYVSQKTHDFGSILRFVEAVFGLPRIPPGTFADARADDLSDFFDFSRSPRSFVPIPAAIGANFFLHDPRPVTAPDDQ
jgi:phospholipase C